MEKIKLAEKVLEKFREHKESVSLMKQIPISKLVDAILTQEGKDWLEQKKGEIDLVRTEREAVKIDK